MERYELPLDTETGKSVTQYLFKDVENTPEIRKKLMSGEIRCCIINACMVVDPLQVSVAANKASLKEARSQMTTKSIFTEILFVMAASTNISYSLAKFGIHDKAKNIVVVFLHSKNDEEALEKEEQVLRHIQGCRVPIDNIAEFTDEELVKRTYKIRDKELEVYNLRDSVISRIASEPLASLK